MSASTSEIARDILVASLEGRNTNWDGEELGKMYADLLKVVGEAIRAENGAHNAHYR